MNKIDKFVIESIAQNIQQMNNDEIFYLAQLLIESPDKAERMSNSINFAFMDKQYVNDSLFAKV